MRILACIGQLGKMDAACPARPENRTLDKALQIKKETDGELIVAVLAAKRSRSRVEELFSLGVDHTVFIPVRVEGDRPVQSLLLGNEIEKLVAEKTGPIDLVLCDEHLGNGKPPQADDGPNMCTVVDSERTEKNRLRVRAKKTGYAESVRILLPKEIFVESNDEQQSRPRLA